MTTQLPYGPSYFEIDPGMLAAPPPPLRDVASPPLHVELHGVRADDNIEA